MDFLRAIKICSTLSFGGEVKPSAPFREILQHLKIPTQCDSDNSLDKYKDISRQRPASLLDVSAATRGLWWMNQK
jgi:hypothetical protein